MYVFEPILFVPEVGVAIIQPEGYQFEEVAGVVHFVQEGGQNSCQLDACAAPVGGEVKSEVFELQSLDLHLLVDPDIGDGSEFFQLIEYHAVCCLLDFKLLQKHYV